jgi:hypothetical protein
MKRLHVRAVHVRCVLIIRVKSTLRTIVRVRCFVSFFLSRKSSFALKSRKFCVHLFVVNKCIRRFLCISGYKHSVLFICIDSYISRLLFSLRIFVLQFLHLSFFVHHPHLLHFH